MLRKDKKRATATDVAGIAGVSRFTVARAFAEGSNITEEKRERILAVARELGFRPNALARSLKSQESMLVGIVSGALANNYDNEVVSRLVGRIVELGKWPVVFGGSSDDIRKSRVLNLLDLPLDALIIRGGSVDLDLAEQCTKMAVPVIVSGRILDVPGAVDSICCDNAAGAAIAADCLLDRGRKRLAFIGGPRELFSTQERAAGFYNKLVERGAAPCVTYNADYSFEGGYTAIGAVLQDRPDIDGVFCCNDAMALGALSALRGDFGRNVPGDVSVIGFDDIDMASWPCFALTTIENHAASIADRIIDRLNFRLKNPDAEGTQQRFAPEIILRGTH